MALVIPNKFNLGRALSGWQDSCLTTYREAYETFGGSINMSPDIISFFIHEHADNFKFFHYKKKGRVNACYFTNKNNDIGLDYWQDYPVTFDEIQIPMDDNIKIFLPAKSNKLSFKHAGNIRNCTFTLFRKKCICIVKDSFSAKSEKNRRNEFNRFIKNGGKVVNSQEITPARLADIYIHLFRLRFGDSVRCYDRNKLTIFLSRLNHMVFGNVLFIHGQPCAFDLILKAESRDAIYFDVPNGGVDPNYHHLSIGSVLMWLNIKSANELCTSKGKKKIMSIGARNDEWKYKERWADPVVLGKIIF